MRIVPMTPGFAAEIVTWRYPAPYDCYDMTGANPAFIASAISGFFALVRGDELIGFRSFGADGQVPGGDYDESALDTGGGLRPDLTGKGLGRQAIATGLEFGRREFAPPAFRVTVASFNERALRVVRSLGFRAVASFPALADGRSYQILARPEPEPRNRAGQRSGHG
jgi:[ribosomal protein S18]-alanine N-acetyltransferase